MKIGRGFEGLRLKRPKTRRREKIEPKILDVHHRFHMNLYDVHEPKARSRLPAEVSGNNGRKQLIRQQLPSLVSQVVVAHVQRLQTFDPRNREQRSKRLFCEQAA